MEITAAIAALALFIGMFNFGYDNGTQIDKILGTDLGVGWALMLFWILVALACIARIVTRLFR